MNTKIKFIILGSVLLNVLLVGFILGQSLHKFGPPPPPPPLEEAALARLSPEKRQEVEKIMEEMKEDGRAMRETVRKEREKVTDILKAETFDEAAYRAQLDKVGSIYRARKDKLANRIAELAKTWPASDRAVLADLLRRPPVPPHGPGPHGHDGPPPPPPGEGPDGEAPPPHGGPEGETAPPPPAE
ncbi:periplasmic heavy metal sensor [bacterium]|nr:periplasmic heavy metal sensor [bacterium]